VPNQRGLERALDTGVQHICTFMSASETHNKKNVNRTRAESLAALQEVIGVAKDEGMGVRSYLSTVFGCPYEGAVPVAETLRLAQAMLDAGADEIALGDTTGMGDPRMVVDVLRTLTGAGIPLDRLSLHMHDTRGTALANVLTGWQLGVRTFDGSVGGLGGCPYAPGAAGNAASDDLVNLFESMGVHTGIDLVALAEAGHFLAGVLGRPLPGRYHRYHQGQRAKAPNRAPTGHARNTA
jgi:hydroxymethylglutaryl-CoA lyase